MVHAPFSLARLHYHRDAGLIRKVWSADPLVCPKCSGPMRIISFIEDPSVIEKILRLIGQYWIILPGGRDFSAPLLS